MLFSRSPSDESLQCEADGTLAKPLAPEDVRAGDYVAVLHVIHEWPAFFWTCDTTLGQQEELLRVKMLPEKSGVPLKVKAICLPFVLVKHPKGKQLTLDVRRYRLARLGPVFARAAWKSLRPKKKAAAANPTESK